MNKYSLTFKSQEIENQFVKDRAQSILIPCFYGITVSFALILIIRIISNKIEDEQFSMLINIGALLSDLVLIGVTYNSKSYNTSNIILNLGMAFFQFTAEREQYSQNSYVLGSNIMMVHSILLMNTNLISGIITNIILSIIKVSIALVYSENRDYQVYFLSFFMSGLYSYLIYKVTFYQRYSFFQTLKDNQWEQILTHIFSDPFILYSYDDKSVKFKLKCQSKVSNLSPLGLDEQEISTFIIRNSQIQNEKRSLENMMFERVNTHRETAFQEQLISITLNKQSYNIIYSEFHIPQFTQLIRFAKLEMSQSHKNSQNLELLSKKFFGFCQFIYSLTQKKISNKQKLFRLQYASSMIIWKYRWNIEIQMKELIDPIQTMKNKIDQFNKSQKKIIIAMDNQFTQKIKVNCDQVQYKCLIYELFSCIYNGSNQHCILDIQNIEFGILTFRIYDINSEIVSQQIRKNFILRQLSKMSYLIIQQTSQFSILISFKLI